MPAPKKAPKSQYSQRVYFKTKRVRRWVDEYDKAGGTPESILHLKEALSEARGLVALLERDVENASANTGSPEHFIAPKPVLATGA
jgi:hypothetical protein